MLVEPVVLEGEHIRLEPLSLDHHAALCEVGLEEAIWQWNTEPVRSPEEMRAYIAMALQWQAQGTALPFATVEKSFGLLQHHRFGMAGGEGEAGDEDERAALNYPNET